MPPTIIEPTIMIAAPALKKLIAVFISLIIGFCFRQLCRLPAVGDFLSHGLEEGGGGLGFGDGLEGAGEGAGGSEIGLALTRNGAQTISNPINPPTKAA